MKLKWSKYVGCDGFILIATTSEERKRNLMAQASEAKSLALFGVIEDILKDPVGKVWTDVTGKICALPKPSAKATAK